MAERINVMISSTARDLPEHREEALDACIRQGMFPMMMEYLPALDVEAIQASLDMVAEADIYIGIFAHRYGYIPRENNPKEISITEMEYDRAVERDIPRFIFLIHDDHDLKAADFEKGIGGEKLERFKTSLGTDRVANFFKSPADLRSHVINTLARYKERKAAEKEKSNSEQSKLEPSDFHYVSTIPKPPDTYIAHPYTLLQTNGLVGRQDEINILTDWVAKPEAGVYEAHVLSVVAIGGMGKSALTWNWFNTIAPKEMKPLAGRMWWSFYESDASFENFVIRALAYVSKRSIEGIRQMPSPERESELLAVLDHERFLIVLDGLERILIAYSRMDAARLGDAQVSSQKNMRKTADPRAGQFLKKLAQTKNSRILISTRLYPAELETEGGDPLPNISRLDLGGMSEDDALQLWRAFGVSGSRDLLGPIFDSIDRHPLLIQALAGEVKRYKKAPGNFEEWLKNNPRFDPTKFPKVQEAMGHVIEYALQDLKEEPQKVLRIISAFRMPVGYSTLTALVIGGENSCGNEMELDAILVELEDRGLVGWDKRANRYDLHPIVRGVVWSGLGDETRLGVYTTLHAYFGAMPMIGNWREVESFEDLTPAIELYNTLIGMERYDEAYIVLRDRLDDATHYRLSASQQRAELLEMLFPDGGDKLPRLSVQAQQAFTLNALAQAYQLSGHPGLAARLYRKHNTIRSETGSDESLGIGLENLSQTLRLTGRLRESEDTARGALEIARGRGDIFAEAISLQYLGLALAVRGESAKVMRESLDLLIEQHERQSEGLTNANLAQRAIWSGEYSEALPLANRAEELAHALRSEGDFIRAARVQGEAALGLDDLASADERLNHTVTRARAVNMIEEEIPALIALAGLRRREGNENAAREYLDDVWEFAERGPYPLLHADALNVLAQIERDAGNKDGALEAATKAYQLAWCDGPPFAYHWGLIKAQKHLEELGAALPEMRPFNETD